MQNLADIKARIAKLSRMTVDNGCSEAEAMSAAAKIQSIIAEHGITIGEVKDYIASNDPNKEKMEEGFYGRNQRFHEVSRCLTDIANLFDCQGFKTEKVVDGKKIKVLYFYGFPQDVAAAMALTDLIARAMENDFRNYLLNNRTQGYHGKTLRKAFMLGFAGRVRIRLRAMKEETKAKPTGTELIILKNQVVSQHLAIELKAKGIRVRTTTSKTTYRSVEAYAAGQSAGDKAVLNNNKRVGGF
jgi:hypothetical protein